jgi:hypothetical protein
MKARVSQLHKTEAEWLKLASFVPAAGELIIYDADEKYPYARIKVGDGNTLLKNLPFFIDMAALKLLREQQYTGIIDGGCITDYVKK